MLCRVGVPEAPGVAPVFNCEEVEKPAAALRGRAILDIGAILPPGEDIAQVIAADYPWAWHRRLLREMRRAQPLFLGDYYPVIGEIPDPRQWALYQMNRPDLGEGLVMALRRPDSAYSAATIRLQGLRAAARYVIETSGKVAGKRIRTGRDLMENGLEIRLTRAPDGCVVFDKQGRLGLFSRLSAGAPGGEA